MKWHRIKALLLKYWYISTNSLPRIFDMFYWPIISIVVFGFTTLYIKDAAEFPNIMVFLLGGLILWVLLERAQQDVAIFVLEDFWSNNVANTFSTPIKESELFVSLIITGLIRGIISFSIMYFIAIFAYNFNLFQGNPLIALYIIPLLLTAWGLGIFVSGLVYRFGIRIGIFAWSMAYLLQPFAGVFYPISTLPIIMQNIAKFTPLMYVFEGFRNSYLGSFDVSSLITAVILALIFMAIGFTIFMFSLNVARKKALLAKY
jgi:ABC-2 type transport system permease protein